MGSLNSQTETSTVLYFAYGSNLFSERIHLHNKSAVFRSVGLLKGYRLEFCYRSPRWRGSAANIVQDPSSNIYGVLWELDRSDLANLDNQEGVNGEVGIYKRIRLTIEVDGVPVPSFGYQLTELTRSGSILKDGEGQEPSKVYKDIIVNGAVEHRLPAEYVAFLENIPDNGFDGEVNLSHPE